MVNGQQVTLDIFGQLIYHSDINVLCEVQASPARLQPAFRKGGTSLSKIGFGASFFAPSDIHWLFGFVGHFTRPGPDSRLDTRGPWS